MPDALRARGETTPEFLRVNCKRLRVRDTPSCSAINRHKPELVVQDTGLGKYHESTLI